MPRKATFPASRELFHLARAVADKLELAVTDRLSDADIGRFVGFESARTSRWKHGQIAVQDAARLVALSQSLDIDLTVLSHVAAGSFTAEEALEILSTPSRLVRFLGEQIVLPADNQELTLIGDGTRCKIIRRSLQHYRRQAKRLGREGVDEQDHVPTVLLVDNNRTTIRYFRSHTGGETGISGVVARSGPEALIAAGKVQPQIIIFDLFIGQTDGFAAVKSIVDSDATSEAEVYATTLTMTPEITRSALGVGARDVLLRPLNSRTLGVLINKARARR
jgi:CheY-like chemotaxis protein